MTDRIIAHTDSGECYVADGNGTNLWPLTVYVVVDVGCIECGEGTDVRVFSSEVIAETYRDEQRKWQRENWSGEHRFDLFALTVDGPSAAIVSSTVEDAQATS